MPRKHILCPEKLRIDINDLKRKYGSDILSRASNIYFFCYLDTHSQGITDLAEEVEFKKIKIKFPFLKTNLKREWGMIYLFLIDEMLIWKKRHLRKLLGITIMLMD